MAASKAAMDGASYRLVDVEDLSESDLETRHEHYRQLAQLSRAEIDIHKSHSIDEAQERYRRKFRKHRTT